MHHQIKNDMNYILKTDIKDFDALIAELNKRYLVRSEHSCNKHNAFGIATYFWGEVRKFIFLSERMCCSDPMVSWITSRKRCVSEDEFLSEIDAKIRKQIEK